MSNRRSGIYTLFLLLAMLGLMLVACGGEDPTPTPLAPTDTPVPTNTPAPTDTPVPTDTPEPTPTQDPTAGFIDLSSPEGGFTVRYPGNWFADDFLGFTTLASKEELLDGPEPGEEGGVAIVVAGDNDEFGGADPVSGMDTVLDEFNLADDATIVEGPTATIINGQNGAFAVVNGTSDNDIPIVGYVVTVVSGGRTVVFIGVTPADTEAEFRPIFEAISKTIEVGEPTVVIAPPPETEGFLLYGDTVTSAVTESGPSVWSFIGIEGEVVDITVRPLDEDLDAVIDILDESGASILDAEIDDAFGTEEIMGFVIESSGELFISIRGFADSVGEYELTVVESGGVASGGTFPTGGSLSYGDRVNGTVAGEDASVWAFTGSAGDVINITVEPVDDQFDVVVDVLDASGTSILANGEVDDSFGKEEILGLNIPSNGSYTVSIRGFAGQTGDYRLSAVEAGGAGATGGQLQFDETVDGSVTAEGPSTWQFFGAARDLVDITVAPFDDFDLVVDVLDAGGSSILDDGPVDLSFDAEHIRVLRLPDDGAYVVSVTGFDGTVGDYEITLSLTNGGLPGSIIFASDVLEAGDEAHAFPFNNAAGETVTILVEPDYDVVLSVYNDDTDELIEEVDDTTRFEELAFDVPTDDNYYFEVSGFEGETGSYDVTLFGPDTVRFELAIDDQVIGRLGVGRFIEYIYGGVSGEAIEISAESSDIDVVITIVDANDNVLAEIDDTLAGEGELLSYTPTEDGLIYIRVSDFFEGEGEFNLFIAPG